MTAMKKLEKLSGLNIELGEDELKFAKEDFAVAVAWTKDFEFAKYAYADGSQSEGENYFGIRYAEKTADQDLLKKHDLMVDMTVLNAGKVGKEFLKTVGHYHGHIEGLTISYPEVYEAVTDGIEYLLQSEPDNEGRVAVIWVVTEAGDKVVMPPNWGHVSMNVGNNQAVEVDVQKRDNPNHSDYSVFKEKVGGAFYRTAEGLVRNPNYEISSLRIVRPLEKADWGLTKNKPLYKAVIENPEKFDYLAHPQNYEFNLNEFFEDIEL